MAEIDYDDPDSVGIHNLYTVVLECGCVRWLSKTRLQWFRMERCGYFCPFCQKKVMMVSRVKHEPRQKYAITGFKNK